MGAPMWTMTNGPKHTASGARRVCGAGASHPRAAAEGRAEGSRGPKSTHPRTAAQPSGPIYALDLLVLPNFRKEVASNVSGDGGGEKFMEGCGDGVGSICEFDGVEGREEWEVDGEDVCMSVGGRCRRGGAAGDGPLAVPGPGGIVYSPSRDCGTHWVMVPLCAMRLRPPPWRETGGRVPGGGGASGWVRPGAG